MIDPVVAGLSISLVDRTDLRSAATDWNWKSRNNIFHTVSSRRYRAKPIPLVALTTVKV